MAHRGDQEKSPENSLLAMKNAVKIANVLETDVRLTKDRKLVLFHDSCLERTTNQKGRIIDYNFNELEKIDLGYNFTLDSGKTFPFRGKGMSIISLEKAFTEFPTTLFNLDIKNEEPEAPEILADLIKKFSRQSSIIVGSFHHIQIEKFRGLQPKVMTSASPNEVKKFLIYSKIHMHRFLFPEYKVFQVPIFHGKTRIVSRRFVDIAHSKGIAVHVWTINDLKEMKYLIDLKVDGIFTDFPRLLADEISNRKKGKNNID